MSTYQNKIDKLVEKILNEEIDKKVSVVLETLKGGQNKLDVAEPKGKLTAADFKKLRQKKSSKKEVDESWEELDEYGNHSPSDNDMDELLHRYEIDKLREKQQSNKNDFEDTKSDMSDDDKKPSFMSRLKNKLGFGKNKEFDEEMEEGNAFSGALEKARKQHKDSFEVDGETYPVREGKEKWIQKTKMHKGALHKKLNVPEDEKIPVSKLKSLKKELQGKSEGDKKLSASDSKLLKQVNLALNLKSLKESSNLTLTEDELIDMIEKIIVEEKKQKEEDVKVSKVTEKLKDNISKKYVSGLAKTKKAQDGSKKENDDYISSVTKKITDYLKDGSKIKFEMNTDKFPEGNGQKEKDDTKAYHASDAVDEYIEAFSYPGMTNLVYDEIKPEDEKIEMYLKGNSKTGNAQVDKNGKALGNVVPSEVGERFMKNYKDNVYGAEQMSASYKRYPQPVDMAGEKTESGNLKQKKGAAKAQKILDKVDESETKSQKVISEEMEKMKNLISYNKKTQ
jgi:hypothetical protein